MTAEMAVAAAMLTTAGGDETFAEGVLLVAEGGDADIAVGGEAIEIAAQVGVEGFEIAGQGFGALRKVIEQARVAALELIDRNGGIEGGDVGGGGAKEPLGAGGLFAQFGDGGVAGGDAGGDELFMGQRALGGGEGGNSGLGDAHLGVERGEMEERSAHQHADRGDQRDEQKAAENESLIETQHERQKK